MNTLVLFPIGVLSVLAAIVGVLLRRSLRPKEQQGCRCPSSGSTPNGGIRACHSASEALREVQQAAKRGNRGVTITTIEWRDVPDGFEPPKGGGQ